MRELTLMARLGHASPDSTKMYTCISDREVVEDYRRAWKRETREHRCCAAITGLRSPKAFPALPTRRVRRVPCRQCLA
jgi:hypothetical protein